VRFGVSTHISVAERLDRELLVDIAAHGFDAVEVFALTSHFDYRDKRAAEQLTEWLDDTRLRLNSFHAPIARVFSGGAWRDTITLAAGDEASRKRAVEEAQAVLDVADIAPYQTLVVHAGVPAPYGTAAENNRASMRRSLEELAPIADKHGVRIAVEVIPNQMSGPTALVDLIEEELELPNIGICMDVGHARLMGDVVDAIETCSGHIITTHLHDNRGKSDDHLVPGQGAIDWDAAMLSFQKVGYDGAWMFELAVAADRKPVLERAQRARERFEGILKAWDLGLEAWE
jgi:sugar phosphate isomerase/epimerase